ncbi:MAG: transcription antitermination factor NusB [Bacteroidales bacterium]|nr:transcription antitermination factor NusB [Bacteroidales bacterium]
MLSRRQLRIKVLQALYAFFQSKNDSIDIGEKNLLKSIDKLYELYIYQFSFIIEIVEFAKKKNEEAKLKYLPTAEDLNPNTKFIDNKFIKQLADNKNLTKQIDLLRISWVEEKNIFKKLYQTIKESKEYTDYINSPYNSYHSDKEIIIKIFSKYIASSEILQSFYEEKNIHWADAYYTVSIMIIKTLKSFKEEWDEFELLPVIFKQTEKDNTSEDRDFIIHLFRKTIIHSEDYANLISNIAKNWEMERIAVVDFIIMKMALAELQEFSSIPIKVSMNEYIEISKLFSTPKSKIFVNGILDKLIKELNANNKIKKIGRGLI